MTCPCCNGGANVFGENMARSEVKDYRRKGAGKVTRLLIEALRGQGVDGLTLLDIGGGVGAISMELLKSGVTSAAQIDASPAYVAAATAEAAREGLGDRFAARQGDFVALAEETPEAGVVTLDKVICCYPNMPALVGASAARATRLYGAIYPRDFWWARYGARVANFFARLFRAGFQFYVHPTTAVDAAIRQQGLTPAIHRNAGFWQVVVYARPA